MTALTDLADVCRRTGWPVIEVDGWQGRGRGGSGGHQTGGYQGSANHVIVHHTASGLGSDGWPDVNYCTFGDSDAPLCNIYIDRAGCLYVCASMGTNCNGSGHDPCNHIADDTMNSNAIAIEAGNDGSGERWPEAQLDSYNALCAELCSAYGIPNGRLHSHAEYAPSRKVDPAGPDRYASGKATWDMAHFRADCGVDTGGGSPIPPVPPGDDEFMLSIWGYSGNDTNGAIYAVSSAGFKYWLVDSPMVSSMEAYCAVNGWDSTWKNTSDRNLFKAFGPVLGPAPVGSDSWGLPG